MKNPKNIYYSVLLLLLLSFVVSAAKSETIRKAITVNLFYPPHGFQNGQGVPNWFYYWKQGNAVPDMDAFEYDAVTDDALGYFSPSQFKVFLTSGAATSTTEFELENSNNIQEKYVVGINAVGIDACAAVCAHEMQHMLNYMNLRRDPQDRDVDGVTDDEENNSPYHLDPDKQDTYGLAEKFKGTPYYEQYKKTGDNEFLAFMAQRHHKPVDASKDWSVGGKNWRN